LSACSQIVWSTELFEQFQASCYPALVAAHQDFEICSLSREQVGELLIKIEGVRSAPVSEAMALTFGVA